MTETKGRTRPPVFHHDSAPPCGDSPSGIPRRPGKDTVRNPYSTSAAFPFAPRIPVRCTEATLVGRASIRTLFLYLVEAIIPRFSDLSSRFCEFPKIDRKKREISHGFCAVQPVFRPVLPRAEGGAQDAAEHLPPADVRHALAREDWQHRDGLARRVGHA